jgi:hypothetical protein
MPQQQPRRLDSWKDIAAYLQRDQRTAMRWEKEGGLPVHRVPGAKRHVVFAYSHEIDAWLIGSKPSESRPSATQAAYAAPLRGWIPRNPPLAQAVAIAALAIGLYAMLGFLWKSSFAGALASVALKDKKFVGLDRTGKDLWTYPLPEDGVVPPPGRTPGIDHLGDLAADGHREVLIGLPRPDHAAGETRDAELFCFSETGNLLWKFDPQDTIRFVSGDYGPPWNIERYLLYRVGGETRIALVFTHQVWWPSILVILDAHGHELGRFVNSGDILTLTAAQSPSGPLLLIGGVSNSNGLSGFFAVLDGSHPTGTSPERSGSEFECTSCSQGHPLHYFVFPRSEINILSLASYGSVDSIRAAQSGVEVQTEEANAQDVGAAGIFEFTSEFELKKARWSDGYRQMHELFEREGKIHHPWDHCPDRSGPRVVRSWDALRGFTEVRLQALE